MNKALCVPVKFLISLISLTIIFSSALSASRRLFPVKYTQIAESFCSRYDADIYLVMALIKAESNFDENAVSHAGASGIMQLTEQTFDYCCDKLGTDKADSRIFDVKQNMQAGIWYISRLTDKFNGNIKNAVAAYNAGASTVYKWLENPEYSRDGKSLHRIPYRETHRYAEKIEKYIKIYRFLYPNLGQAVKMRQAA